MDTIPMPRMLATERIRERFFLILLIVFYFMLIVIQYGVPKALVPTAEVEFNTITLHVIGLTVVSCSLFQLLSSLYMVMLAKKRGLVASVLLNLTAALLAFFLVISRNHYMLIPCIGINIVAMLICFLVYYQMQVINGNVAKLHDLAYTDMLTGLPNRNAHFELLQSYIDGEKRQPVFTLILLDFDNFKMINDYLGHQIGDVFLMENAGKLKKAVREKATVARTGDDRFSIILPGAVDRKELQDYAGYLQEVISVPFHHKGHDYHVSASMGISCYPKDSTTLHDLLRQAEIALYRAKSLGKNKVVFFQENMQKNLERRVSLENMLFTAIQKKELYLEFQPQYHIPDRRLRGFEVLVRWESPQLGHIPPVDFIPLAEANGSIVTIGKWILQEACREYMSVLANYERRPTLSVNISVVQFRSPDFMDMVRSVLAETGIDPANLEFEITESVCINSPEQTKAILKELKQLGIRLSMDDFGTGYSSLSYLRTLPLDVVKIDKSFIDPIGTIPDDKNIVRSIIDMAHQLDLQVVAEGIESLNQFDYLVRYNCDYIQGNYLGRPAPIHTL